MISCLDGNTSFCRRLLCPRMGSVDRLTVLLMLALFALPSLGITPAATRSFLGGQGPAELVEEVEERLPCPSQRRLTVNRTSGGAVVHASAAHARLHSSRPVTHPHPVCGHRNASGHLAPLRC